MSISESIVSAVVQQLAQAPRAVVAITGPQGSGKTTVTQQAVALLRQRHIPAVGLSLDDFYKPHAELRAIAARGNPLLQRRGLPGTHDAALLAEFLSSFKAGARGLSVPTYDKSLHSGAGDRAAAARVPDGTVAVLVEGWMVGFRPVGAAAIAQRAPEVAALRLSVVPSVADLLEIDASLRAYVPIWDALDAAVRLVPDELRFVYNWRLQQEHDLWAHRGAGMTDAEVKLFVDQYMPCYCLYSDTLAAQSPALVFRLGADHQILSGPSGPSGSSGPSGQ